MEQSLFEFELPERTVYTVSELNARIRALFDEQFADVWVSGEISGTKLASSGHLYFTLKDEQAALRCTLFKGTSRYLKFKPQDGLSVIVRGRLDVWDARGDYSLIVERLEPQGYGALQLAFEQLKKKLAAEGLFDDARKRKLPRYPRRIGLVTSPGGAVIADMLQILSRRFPGLHIRLYPAQVQGEGAVADVCRGLAYFSQSGWAEVVIVARGGGSLEDLWTFNEEAVARAIAACAVPVVSAIGHETDVTIADFVADRRAATPSAAAEIVVPTRAEVLDQIEAVRARAVHALRYQTARLSRRLHQQGIDRAFSLLQRAVGRLGQRTDEAQNRMRDRLRAMLASRRRRIEEWTARVRHFDPRPRLERSIRRRETAHAAAVHAVRMHVARRRARHQALHAKLEQLSPLRVLERGYAIVTDSEGGVLTDAAHTSPGADVRVRLAKGRLAARVTSTQPDSTRTV